MLFRSEVLDPQPAPAYWAVELSSYQTGEVARSGARPQVAAVLNLFPEHLDWHGSEQRYTEDKLPLGADACPRIAALHAAGALAFCGPLAPLSDPRAFARALAPVRRKRWVVYAKPPFAGPKAVLA